MKTNISDLSKAALIKHINSGKALTQIQKITYFFRTTKGERTRRELSKILNIEYASVCGRVNTMIEDGILIESGIKKNETKRLASIIKLNEKK